MRPCFKFTAKAGDKPAVLALDDEIGFWGTQAKDFRASLDAVEGNDLIVDINSPGGDVMAGLGMYNMLRNWAAGGKTVTTRIVGVAASIASIVALAGDKRQMPKNAFAMTHAVSGSAWGTAEELRDTADVIDKIQGSLQGIYIDRMGVDEAKARELMSKDTWLTADECLAMGFATEITDAVQATAKFDLDRADLPETVRSVFKAKTDNVDPPEPEPEPEPEIAPSTPVADEIVALAKTSGFEALGGFFALNFDTVEKAKVRINEAREITALCKTVNKADFANKVIRAGKSLPDARAALVAMLADGDEHTDSAPTNPDKPDTTKPTAVTTETIWASHNAQTKGR